MYCCWNTVCPRFPLIAETSSIERSISEHYLPILKFAPLSGRKFLVHPYTVPYYSTVCLEGKGSKNRGSSHVHRSLLMKAIYCNLFNRNNTVDTWCAHVAILRVPEKKASGPQISFSTLLCDWVPFRRAVSYTHLFGWPWWLPQEGNGEGSCHSKWHVPHQCRARPALASVQEAAWSRDNKTFWTWKSCGTEAGMDSRVSTTTCTQGITFDTQNFMCILLYHLISVTIGGQRHQL